MEENKIEVLKTAKAYINSLNTGIYQAVDYYRTGEESKGSSLVAQISDGIEWLIQALALSSDDTELKEHIGKLNENLKEIVEGFENEDYVLIADILEYEITPVLDEIENRINY